MSVTIGREDGGGKKGGMDRMEGRREGKKGTEKNKGNRKFRKHQVPK